MKKKMKKLGEVGMTGLLLRLFVKNYTDVENTQVRTDVGKLAGVVGNFLQWASDFRQACGRASVRLGCDCCRCGE